MVTIREVADAAEVSQATAARALNGYGSVSARSMAKVTSAAKKLGYRTNVVAQALRRGQTTTVGFVPGDIENPFFAKMAREISGSLEEAGYMLLVSSSDERIDRERKVVGALRQHMVSGLIVAPASEDSAPHLQSMLTEGFPMVLVDRRVERIHADSVTVNNVAAGQQAVAHLISLGHKRIGLVTDDINIASSRGRHDGYVQAHKQAKLPVPGELIASSGPSAQGAYASARRLLALEDRPTAIFTSDNFMTEGVLRAAWDSDLRIPNDISLVGFDDFSLTTFMDPALTVVSQPVAELGREAAQLLLKRLSGDTSVHRHISLLAELVVRDSTRPV